MSLTSRPVHIFRRVAIQTQVRPFGVICILPCAISLPMVLWDCALKCIGATGAMLA